MPHFEDLWEEGEKLLDQETNISSSQELIKETIGKLSLLDGMEDFLNKENSLSIEDKTRLKAAALGKILLTLTQISAKEKINVFAALKAAIDDRKISIFEKKYK